MRFCSGAGKSQSGAGKSHSDILSCSSDHIKKAPSRGFFNVDFRACLWRLAAAVAEVRRGESVFLLLLLVLLCRGMAHEECVDTRAVHACDAEFERLPLHRLARAQGRV